MAHDLRAENTPLVTGATYKLPGISTAAAAIAMNNFLISNLAIIKELDAGFFDRGLNLVYRGLLHAAPAGLDRDNSLVRTSRQFSGLANRKAKSSPAGGMRVEYKKLLTWPHNALRVAGHRQESQAWKETKPE